jgi:hypothetical protein
MPRLVSLNTDRAEAFHAKHNQKTHGRSAGGMGSNDLNAHEKMSALREAGGDGDHRYGTAEVTTAGGRSFSIHMDRNGGFDQKSVDDSLNRIADLADMYGVTPPSVGVGPNGGAAAFLDWSATSKNHSGMTFEQAKTVLHQPVGTLALVARLNDDSFASTALVIQPSLVSGTVPPMDANQFGPHTAGKSASEMAVRSVTHEFGHVLYNQALATAKSSGDSTGIDEVQRLYDGAKNSSNVKATAGKYIQSDPDEFMAESFALLHENVDIKGNFAAAWSAVGFPNVGTSRNSS